MALPDPKPGLVISYAYLWRDEARAGQDEGGKARPCVVILAVEGDVGRRVVTVAPVTHSPPRAAADAVELPPATKARLGLDDARSWIVSTEVNRFVWPGPDLRPISRSRPRDFAFGFIPGAILQRLRDQIASHRRVGLTPRDE
ncbi:MAG TPA: type II toxin-antitoxin system PemK/MazF family toxin [Caulobacteraceae bacterium]